MNRWDNPGIVIGWTSSISVHVCNRVSGLSCVGNVVVAVLMMHARLSGIRSIYTLGRCTTP